MEYSANSSDSETSKSEFTEEPNSKQTNDKLVVPGKKRQSYRQSYRVEWESQPDFKGWLKSIPGQPTRAYCRYCDRSLDAHYLSLLKHMCTLKHTKAAQKAEANQISCTEMSSSQVRTNGISTHVLDTSKGNPGSGIQVVLYQLISGNWTLVSEGVTNSNGRFSDFLKNSEISCGRYKLHFDVHRYFELSKQESFFPFVEIVFDVKSPQEHYHIPLLLSPFGYTTYRGS